MVVDPLFCLLSFEGPDRHVPTGGLGVRVTQLAETLARRGYPTHLVFVGDPALPAREERENGRLTLHRRCQWVDAHYPGGSHAVAEARQWEFCHATPPFLISEIIRPALANGRFPVILAEEWHTADTLIRLHARLQADGLRRGCALFWHTNSPDSCYRVDGTRLKRAAILTTASRYVCRLLADLGLEALVVPNGIPADLLAPVLPEQAQALRAALAPGAEGVMLFKIGRFDAADGWLQAVHAAALLKRGGHDAVLALRGVGAPDEALLEAARRRGLAMVDVFGRPADWRELAEMLRAAPRADVYNLRFHLSQAMLRPFYAAADAVLAHGGGEPFGLAGLEAMAAGGLLFTGATDDYTLDGETAVTLGTDSPAEIVNHVLALRQNAARVANMRRAAQARAAAFTGERVTDVLLDTVRRCG